MRRTEEHRKKPSMENKKEPGRMREHAENREKMPRLQRYRKKIM